ncbi:glycosyltransferase family 4 protein [Rhizorhabdus argentea]|uniref:glycosyltransferase family 4 protein n=1 Tax=Rhizorhabdus argentea TaxID=1387174 RepID=UPI0030EEE8A4
MNSNAPILLVTNMIPPLIGGTPMVYDRMARHGAPHIHVLSAWRDPDMAKPIPGWTESDASKPYPVRRIAWLRPPRIEHLRRRMGLLDLILIDLPVMAFVFVAVLCEAFRIGARTVVIGELQGLGWLAILLGIVTPWRIVMYTHGEEVVQTSYNRLARLRGPALRSSDVVLAVSSFTRDRLISDFGVARERIRLVTSGVDLDRFQPCAASEPFILSVGRLIERKGFDRLVDAFALVAAKFPEVRLRIAGKGPQESALKAQAERTGLGNRIQFMGGVSDAELGELYRSCSFFAMPNRTLADGDTEGFGLIFLEANACGKAVIGGRAGGAPDAIIDGETGLLVDGQDPEAIAAALRRLLADKAYRDRLAAGGLAHARAHGWAQAAERLLQAVRG